jgi:mycoredoxin
VREINIWEDASAAAAVRSLAGGHESVPTVVVCGVTLVEPSAADVINAVRARAPQLLGPANEELPRRRWWKRGR